MFLSLYLFLRESERGRERERERAGEREKACQSMNKGGAEREWDGRSDSRELDVRLKLTNHEIMT